MNTKTTTNKWENKPARYGMENIKENEVCSRRKTHTPASITRTPVWDLNTYHLIDRGTNEVAF